MLLKHELPLTITAVVIFLFLLTMEPNSTQHHFKVIPKKDYPNSDFFSPSQFALSVININLEILANSRHKVKSRIAFSPYELTRTIHTLSTISENESRESAEKLIYDPNTRKEFIKSMIDTDRSNVKLAHDMRFKVSHMLWLQKQFQLSKFPKYEIFLEENTKIFPFEDQTEVKQKIDTDLGFSKHSATGTIQFDSDTTLVALSTFRIRFSFPSLFTVKLGDFFQFGDQKENVINIPVIYNPVAKVQFSTSSDGSKLLAIELKEENKCLVFKWKETMVNKACPLCESIITMEDIQELLKTEKVNAEVMIPVFQINEVHDFKEELLNLMNKNGDNAGTVFNNEGQFKVIQDQDLNKTLKVNKVIQNLHFQLTGHYLTNKPGDVLSQISTIDPPTSGAPRSEKLFHLKYPFSFYVVDSKKKVIYLAGKISEVEMLHGDGGM